MKYNLTARTLSQLVSHYHGNGEYQQGGNIPCKEGIISQPTCCGCAWKHINRILVQGMCLACSHMTKGYKLVITHFLSQNSHVAMAHITATLYWPQPVNSKIQSNRERDGHVKFHLSDCTKCLYLFIFQWQCNALL